LGRHLGDVIDHLLTVQVCAAGGPSVLSKEPVMHGLYRAARSLCGEPLVYGAARRLMEALDGGGRVLFATGFVVPPFLRLETDGPLGVAVLGRALALGLRANPVVVVEPDGVGAMETVMAASGLALARDVEETRDVPHKSAVLPFPVDPEEARREAARLLDDIEPRAVIAVEKPSRNAHGRYHNGMGVDITDVTAKADFLVDEARRRGILTIGYGDGGNEIGMGNIADTVRALVPGGDKVTAVTEVDHLVVTACSTWGAYGTAACLAGMLGRPEVFHDEQLDLRLTDACARAGIVDPFSGLAEGWLDGVPPHVNAALVRLLKFIVEVRLNDWHLQSYREWANDPALHHKLIGNHAARAG